MNNSYIYIYHVNVTQTVPDISPLMPMHQDPLLVLSILWHIFVKSVKYCIFGMEISDVQIHTEITE